MIPPVANHPEELAATLAFCRGPQAEGDMLFTDCVTDLLAYQDRRPNSIERIVSQARLRILCFAAVRHGVAVALNAAHVSVKPYQRYEHLIANITRFYDRNDFHLAGAVTSALVKYAGDNMFDPGDEFAQLKEVAEQAEAICEMLSRGIARPGDTEATLSQREIDLRRRALKVFGITSEMCAGWPEGTRQLVRIAGSTTAAMFVIQDVNAASLAGTSDFVAAFMAWAEKAEASHV